MKNADLSPAEHERIARGEKDYADIEWEICPFCNGSGEDYPGAKTNCPDCRGKGEIKLEAKP